MSTYYGQVLAISRPLHYYQLVVQTHTAQVVSGETVAELRGRPLCEFRISPAELHQSVMCQVLSDALHLPAPKLTVGTMVYFDAARIAVHDGAAIHEVVDLVPGSFIISSAERALPQSIPGWDMVPAGVTQLVLDQAGIDQLAAAG